MTRINGQHNDDRPRMVPLDEEGREITAPMVPVQRVQGRYTTAMAVQRPRELARIEKAALEEAALLGSDAFYGWGAGKDRVEGPSKELAMSLVRCWGNCAVDMGEVQETADAWIFTASFIDLETGFTLTRQFRQAKKWTVHGRFDDARKDDIRFQIGQSKAVRNVVLNAVPGWLSRRAMDHAKGGVREAIEAAIAKHGAPKIIDKCLARLASLGVDEKRVLDTMGRTLKGALTTEDLVILYGNISALESGADTIDAIFPIKQQEPAPQAAPGVSRTEAVAAKLGLSLGEREESPEPAAGPAPTPAPGQPATTFAFADAAAFQRACDQVFKARGWSPESADAYVRDWARARGLKAWTPETRQAFYTELMSATPVQHSEQGAPGDGDDGDPVTAPPAPAKVQAARRAAATREAQKHAAPAADDESEIDSLIQGL